jgi:hypothetical protein
MADVTSDDLDNDHWATSDGVHRYIDIPSSGSQKDVETFIESATDTVQAWWKKATDGDIPGDLPDGSTIEDDHPLLVKSVELLAASEAHESEAQNFRSEQDEGQARHVYLERRAESKFDDWVTVNGYDTTDTTQAQGSDFPATGRSSGLTDFGGDYG